MAYHDWDVNTQHGYGDAYDDSWDENLLPNICEASANMKMRRVNGRVIVNKFTDKD